MNEIVITDEFSIPTKQLFSIYDKKRNVLFHTPMGDLLVKRGDYSYSSKISFPMENDDYQIATFDGTPSNILTNWEKILLEKVHIDWYNNLSIYFKSVIFVTTLKRMKEEGVPTSELFDLFKLPVEETEFTHYNKLFTHLIEYSKRWI